MKYTEQLSKAAQTVGLPEDCQTLEDNIGSKQLGVSSCPRIHRTGKRSPSHPASLGKTKGQAMTQQKGKGMAKAVAITLTRAKTG